MFYLCQLSHLLISVSRSSVSILRFLFFFGDEFLSHSFRELFSNLRLFLSLILSILLTHFGVTLLVTFRFIKGDIFLEDRLHCLYKTSLFVLGNVLPLSYSDQYNNNSSRFMLFIDCMIKSFDFKFSI